MDLEEILTFDEAGVIGPSDRVPGPQFVTHWQARTEFFLYIYLYEAFFFVHISVRFGLEASACTWLQIM